MATVNNLELLNSADPQRASRQADLIAEDLSAARIVPLILIAPILAGVLLAVLTVLICR